MQWPFEDGGLVEFTLWKKVLKMNEQKSSIYGMLRFMSFGVVMVGTAVKKKTFRMSESLTESEPLEKFAKFRRSDFYLEVLVKIISTEEIAERSNIDK